MASLTGAVVDGIYTKNQASTEATKSDSITSTSKTADGKKTEYNQEMFLQLLVAEMQYQDPLEPTSNTEYVSELASFTQIETIQNVQAQMQTLQANSLVGNYVIILDDDNEYVSGKVDYVVNDGGDLYLSVEGKNYSIDKLDSVVDEAYYNAVLTVESFTDYVKRLPTETGVSLSDEKDVMYAKQIYDAMDTYTKGFVEAETLSKLTTLVARIETMKKAVEEASKGDTDSEAATEENSDIETEESSEVAEA